MQVQVALLLLVELHNNILSTMVGIPKCNKDATFRF